MTDNYLDNPVWASLTNKHASVAVSGGDAAAYDWQVSIFWGAKGPGDDGKWSVETWQDVEKLLHKVAGATEAAATFLTGPDQAPAGWETLFNAEVVQMVAPEAESDWLDSPRPPNLDGLTLVELGAADSTDMAELADGTNPGPWRPRTFELGGYHGFRSEETGALVAMAGERLQPPGWAEISAVCTDTAYRGRGLAPVLMKVVGAGIYRRGERPFLHAASKNTGAVRLYENLGFKTRRLSRAISVRPPS